MTVLEFTNKIDGTINDFENGVIDNREFHTIIMDTLIEVAKPVLKKDSSGMERLAEDMIKTDYRQSTSDNDYSDFYTLVELTKELNKRISVTKISMFSVKQALINLGAQERSYRQPYSKVVERGYWFVKK